MKIQALSLYWSCHDVFRLRFNSSSLNFLIFFTLLGIKWKWYQYKPPPWANYATMSRFYQPYLRHGIHVVSFISTLSSISLLSLVNSTYVTTNIPASIHHPQGTKITILPINMWSNKSIFNHTKRPNRNISQIYIFSIYHKSAGEA